ncbi:MULTISPECIES: LysR family transcriptional regulator [Rhizobium]|uniref:LysR family transcriptional regulator n=1 Tax=Rhizobium TaxID=379 RepID=UPI00026ED1C0|nr:MULTISPECIES: LysR substrate-binding domain-containing protein [Rhizobium]EJK88082.1 transcriptional regulator [Rhizobium sp. AP16]NTI43777.1 LysR family transcriptional regulator [Rhizobium rhizogenes]OCJ18951.1 transcriptional regulator [Agrobacterium sp. B131/95]
MNKAGLIIRSLELRHVRYFIAVAEELHFGRAALRLNLVQPALSAQIKALETILGVILLSRTRRRVELTPAGEGFLKDCYETLAHLENAVTSVVDMANGRRGEVRIGYGANATIAGLLVPTIQRFRSDAPDVEIKLTEMSTRSVLESIMRGEIDIGYASLSLDALPEGIVGRYVGEWPWMLAVSSTHPLAGRKHLRLADLANEAFVVYGDSGEHFDPADVQRIHESIESSFLRRSGNLINLATYVAAGLGVALMPKPITELSLPGICYLSVDDLVTPMTMSLLWSRTTTSTAVKNYIAAAVGEAT